MKNNVKKSVLICLCMLLFISPLPTFSLAEDTTEIVFASPVVEDQIRITLAKPKGPITQADMTRVTEFQYAPMIEVTNDEDGTVYYSHDIPSAEKLDDLSDLAHCVNLKVVGIYDQPITSLEPLRDLNKLESIQLQNCTQLTDLSPLSKKPFLKYVSLFNLGTDDISSVLALQNLRSLTVGQIAKTIDLTSLAKNDRLEIVHILPDTLIEDYSPLKSHPNLAKVSLNNIDSNTFHDLVAAWPKLSSITISNSSITSEDIAQLPANQLAWLAVSNCPLGDISPLASLSNLGIVQLTDCGITDIAPLATLTNLQALNLSGNQIIDITPLVALTSLGHIGLSTSDHYTYDDIAALLPNTDISLSEAPPSTPTATGDYSQLVKLSGTPSDSTGEPITFEDKVVEIILRDAFGKTNDEPVTTADMARVTSFDYHPGNCANAIQALGLFTDSPDGEGLYDAEPILTLNDLAHCVNLRVLSVPFQESISSLEPAEHLSNLTDINIYGCKGITDLSPLADKQKLKFAYFGDIGTEDATPILALPKLSQLSFGNSQSDEAIDISALSNGHSLTSFFCSQSVISFDPLKEHKGLKYAAIRGVSAKELEALVDSLPKLNSLGIQKAELTGNDLAILAGTEVEHLQIFDCPLGDISSFSMLTQLRNLTLDNCGITDISPLVKLRLPMGLSLLDNDIRDISPLADMRGVNRITLSESEHYTADDVKALMPGVLVTIEESCTIVGHHHHT